MTLLPPATLTAPVPAVPDTFPGNMETSKWARMLRLYSPAAIGALLAVLASAALLLWITFFPMKNPQAYVGSGNLLPLKLSLVEEKTPELLFMGTSQTNNGFSTLDFEKAAPGTLRSFNLGMPNNQYEVMLSYLKLHVARHGRPAMLLVDLSPTILVERSPHYGKQTRIYKQFLENNPWVPVEVKAAIFRLAFSAAGTIYQFRQDYSPLTWITAAVGKSQPPQVIWDRTTMDGGWTPKPRSPLMDSPEGYKKILAETRKYFLDDLPPMHFGRLHDLLNYCKEQEIPVTLVTWPNKEDFLAMMQEDGMYDLFSEGARNTASKFGAHWIDLNLHNKEGVGFYSDPRHLTPKGAAHFSALLAREVFAKTETPTPQLQQFVDYEMP